MENLGSKFIVIWAKLPVDLASEVPKVSSHKTTFLEERENYRFVGKEEKILSANDRVDDALLGSHGEGLGWMNRECVDNKNEGIS